MSGCGQGHEPAKNLWRKLWIKFLRLTPGRSGNKVKEGGTGLHKTIREINLVYKGLKQGTDEGDVIAARCLLHTTCVQLVWKS